MDWLDVIYPHINLHVINACLFPHGTPYVWHNFIQILPPFPIYDYDIWPRIDSVCTDTACCWPLHTTTHPTLNMCERPSILWTVLWRIRNKQSRCGSLTGIQMEAMQLVRSTFFLRTSKLRNVANRDAAETLLGRQDLISISSLKKQRLIQNIFIRGKKIPSSWEIPVASYVLASFASLRALISAIEMLHLRAGTILVIR